MFNNQYFRLLILTLALVMLAGCISFGETTTPVSQFIDNDLDKAQRNSITMLNYLTVLTQQISESKNSRLYLEEAYSALVKVVPPILCKPA